MPFSFETCCFNLLKAARALPASVWFCCRLWHSERGVPKQKHLSFDFPTALSTHIAWTDILCTNVQLEQDLDCEPCFSCSNEVTMGFRFQDLDTER